MEKKQYTIVVEGCDASTNISLALTEQEAALIRLVAERITEASRYDCMPIMEIKESE